MSPSLQLQENAIRADLRLKTAYKKFFVAQWYFDSIKTKFPALFEEYKDRIKTNGR